MAAEEQTSPYIKEHYIHFGNVGQHGNSIYQNLQ